MSETLADRRRSPRFACGGRARISLLPSDGTFVFGSLRNLSLGGVCLDSDYRMNPGERTEVLVSVNAASFRTIGLVKAIENSRACVEFVHMSAGSKGMLADLVAQISRLQAVMAKLRAARVETETDLLRQLESAGVRTAMYNRIPWIGRASSEANAEAESAPVRESEQRLPTPLLIRVDLFG
jgi:PilZ domain